MDQMLSFPHPFLISSMMLPFHGMKNRTEFTQWPSCSFPTMPMPMPTPYKSLGTNKAPNCATPSLWTTVSPIKPCSEEKPSQPSPPASLKPLRPIFRPWCDDESEQKCDAPSFSPSYSIEPETKNGGSHNVDALRLQSISHIRLPSDESKAALESLATTLGKTVSGYRCIYCGKFYSRKYGLKIHLRTHTGFKPLKCKVCQRAFGDPSNLNKHTRLHLEQGSVFKCSQCGKIMLRKRDLERHTANKHECCISRYNDGFNKATLGEEATEEIDVVGL